MVASIAAKIVASLVRPSKKGGGVVTGGLIDTGQAPAKVSRTVIWMPVPTVGVAIKLTVNSSPFHANVNALTLPVRGSLISESVIAFVACASARACDEAVR